ncbi:MAG TPA: hypothetical protein VD948_07640 [Rhodothermales bacterium]|nr:hypothetical protein [Rhodothermales bacterium]
MTACTPVERRARLSEQKLHTDLLVQQAEINSLTLAELKALRGEIWVLQQQVQALSKERALGRRE